MSHKHRRTAMAALASAGALVVLGSALWLPPSRGPARSLPAPAPVGSDSEAELPPMPVRPLRRMRTSLSLPYFSFAQSLNSRS